MRVVLAMCAHWSFAAIISLGIALGGSGLTRQSLGNDFPLWPFEESAMPPDDDQEDVPRWMLGSRLRGLLRPQTDTEANSTSKFPGTEDFGYVLGQDRPSLWQAVARTPQRMAGRVRSMWDRSLDLLTFDGDSVNRSTRRSRPRRPLLGRLFGRDEEEDTGPRTVKEWMEQERPR